MACLRTPPHHCAPRPVGPSTHLIFSLMSLATLTRGSSARAASSLPRSSSCAPSTLATKPSGLPS